jgi:LPXTG-motif cell wall-anchored protein
VVLNDSNHGVEVKLSSNTPNQTYEVRFANQALTSQTPILIAIGALGLLAIAVAFFLLRKRSVNIQAANAPITSEPSYQQQSPPIPQGPPQTPA